jgi:hypothetical protein
MANAYTAGDVLPFAVNVYDSTGVLANATSVTLTITKPDGTTDGPFTITPTSTGVYSYPYTSSLTLNGRYVGNWQASGTNLGGEPQAFLTLPSVPVLTVGEAKKHIGMSASTADDDELSVFIAVAIPIVEQVVGPITPTTFTQTFDGGRPSVRLNYVPTSITSVKEFGRTLTENVEYVVDWPNGVIRRGTTYFTYTFFYGSQNVSVTYIAGPTVIPANVQFMVKETVKYLWQQVKGGPSSFQEGFASAASTAGVSAAFMARLRLLAGKSVNGPSVL